MVFDADVPNHASLGKRRSTFTMNLLVPACDSFTPDCNTDDPLVDIVLVACVIAAVAVVVWWWWPTRDRRSDA